MTLLKYEILIILVFMSFIHAYKLEEEEQIIFTDGITLKGKSFPTTEKGKILFKTWDGKEFLIDKSIIKEIKSTQLYDSSKLRSPWIAGIGSFILPSSGQFYNGDYKKGIIFGTIIYSGLIVLGINYLGETDSTKTDNFLTGSVAIIISGTYIYSIIDAPLSAIRNNNRLNKLKEKK
ncbi:MAG: hypothetical protein JXA60_01175 [Candidatus Coatesbacteria bacterium]|nr:hypothetical protein [Candidatus Coatesbacteria bacterium]